VARLSQLLLPSALRESSPSSFHAISMRNEADRSQPQTVEDEVAELERRLEEAKSRLKAKGTSEGPILDPTAGTPILRAPGKPATFDGLYSIFPATSDTRQVLSVHYRTTSCCSLQTRPFHWALLRSAVASNRISFTAAVPPPSPPFWSCPCRRMPRRLSPSCSRPIASQLIL
jgi:hypothetical protein